MKKNVSEYERFMALSPVQRERETAAFDKEDLTPGKPLSPRDRKEFERLIKRGRPPVGLGAEKIRISVERGLLSEADRLARRRRMNRSQLIAEGLRTLIKAG